ncbi:hypothetical protein LU640_30545, partial [Pseudomonas monteilii]
CFMEKLGWRDRRISPDAGSLFQTFPSRTSENIDKRGNVQAGKNYEFDRRNSAGEDVTVKIRDDAGGHYFGKNNSQNRGPHFNDENNGHYDY